MAGADVSGFEEKGFLAGTRQFWEMKPAYAVFSPKPSSSLQAGYFNKRD
jgi:hypothetical protein